MNTWTRSALVFVCNLCCVFLLAAPIYLINRYATPHVRGFDPSSAAKALPFKPDTVPPIVAGGVALAMTLVPIICLELFVKFYFHCEPCPTSTAGGKVDFAACCRSTWTVWLAIGRLFAVYFAGYALTGVITDIIKYMVARPRPSFLHMCQPDYTKTNYEPCIKCGSHSNPGVFWPMCPECVYIPPNMTSIVCQQSDWWIARNMWLSFPSGHSSYTFYSGTFLALYLFKRLARFPVIIFSVVALRPLIVFASLVFSLYVGLSRISDDRHHVTDVVGGGIIGIVVGLFCAYFVAFPSLQNLPNFLSINRDNPSRADKDLESGKADGNTAPFLPSDEADPKKKLPDDKCRSEAPVPEQATPF